MSAGARPDAWHSAGREAVGGARLAARRVWEVERSARNGHEQDNQGDGEVHRHCAG